MEDLVTQLEEMEQEAKKVTEETTQFWGSVVQDEQLEQLNTQMQEEEGQLATLKTSLRALPPVVQITKSAQLKELQQSVVKAWEHQQRRSTQLDEFQDIGVQLSVYEVATLQAVQEGRK